MNEGHHRAWGRLGPPAVLAAVALVMMAACLPAVARAATTTKAWTVMIYLDADNSLEKLGPSDFVNEMCNPGSTSNVNVVVLMDRGKVKDSSYGGWTDTKLFYCTAGETPTAANAVADWGERDMGNPQTLTDFITYSKANYPASHYLLCFWDHGFLWYPGYYTLRDDTGVNRAATMLDIDEQGTALAATGGVDVIGSDQCQMQMIENDSVWQPYAKAVCASQDTVNNTGLNYGAIVSALQATPSMTAEQAANMVGQTTLTPTDSMTYSAVQLDARFTALESAVNKWATDLKAAMATNKAIYKTAQNATQGSDSDTTMRDLYDAAYQIKARVTDATIKADCDAVMTAVTNDVTFNWTDGTTKEARAHGISIWWPTLSLQYKMNLASIDDWAYYTTKIPFGATNAWSQFLYSLVN